VEQLFDRKLPGARAAGIARTKWIDDEVTQALETSTQLVLLGAGFDTRAYRLPAAQRVTTFELDHPKTSLAKQAALRKEIGSLPKQVQFVSIDFNIQPVADVLSQAGFDWTQSTCFVWEGVTNYLSPEAVDGHCGRLRKLLAAASCCSRTSIAEFSTGRSYSSAQRSCCPDSSRSGSRGLSGFTPKRSNDIWLQEDCA